MPFGIYNKATISPEVLAMKHPSLLRSVCGLAIPVALQSMLQSSFSIIDQIMLGQLGSVSIAAVGLAGKLTMMLNFLLSAVGAVAGILISQYLGSRNDPLVRRSFQVNLYMAMIVAGLFTALGLGLPNFIMGLYSQDTATVREAGIYLRIVSLSFFPLAVTTLLAAWFRCKEQARLCLYATIFAAVCNTLLNWVLIFGHWGLPALGSVGAAWATVISQWINMLVMLLLSVRIPLPCKTRTAGFNWRQYAAIALPMVVCEFAWCLGENVYGAIYGHLGTDPCAAMTLLNPIQGMMTGALCGLSQAAGVLVGKQLGAGQEQNAYTISKKLIGYGYVAALVLSLLLIALRGLYVEIYQVSSQVKVMTQCIILAYAVIAPIKVQNMIVSGGILRSGGKTDYVMWIDLTGTWLFGVPLGLLSAFVWQLPVYWVYFILSLEELVRYGISLVIFRRRHWMRQL